MNTPENRNGSKHSLGTWTRVYLHGAIACAAIAAIAYLFTRLSPVFDFTGNRVVTIATTILAILLGPPLIGSFILFILFPMLGKKEAWRGWLAWDNDLFNEVARAEEKARVVIIPWPSDKVRTMGVLTSTFASEDSGKQMAAVYVHSAPFNRLGYIRIVAVDDVDPIDWTLDQWQLFQLTYGSSIPDRLTDVAEFENE